jgi:hypothetical protein
VQDELERAARGPPPRLLPRRVASGRQAEEVVVRSASAAAAAAALGVVVRELSHVQGLAVAQDREADRRHDRGGAVRCGRRLEAKATATRMIVSLFLLLFVAAVVRDDDDDDGEVSGWIATTAESFLPPAADCVEMTIANCVSVSLTILISVQSVAGSC